MGLTRNLILTLAAVKSLSGQGSIREAYLSKKGGPSFNWQGYDDYGYDVMGFDEFGYDLYGKPMYDPYAGLQGSNEQQVAQGQFFDPSHGTHLEDDDVKEYEHFDGADGDGDKDDDDYYDSDKYDHKGKEDDDDVPWWHKPFPSGTDKADPGWWDWYWEEVSMTDALPTASIFFTDTFDFHFPRPSTPTTMTMTETTTQITPTAYITTTGGSSMTITVPATEVYSCGKAAYCQEYETECCDGVPLCKPGKCEYGYYNSLSLMASECIDTELCIAGTQSVAISGDGCWVIQGVPSNTTHEAITSNGLGLTNEQLLWRGWATVWHLADGIWMQYQLLIPSDGVLADWFGISVDICGDGSRIVVGSWLDSENGVRSGSAYVFSWAPGTHTYRQEAKLMPSDGQAFDYFGQSVRISHDCDTVVVGAFGNDANGALSGAAYVYLAEEIPGAIPSHSPSPTPNFDNKTFIDPTQAKKDRKQKCEDDKKPPIQTHRWLEVQKIDLGFDGSPMDMFGQSLAVNGDGTRIFISGRNIESVIYYKFEMSFMRWVLQEEIKPDQMGMIAFGHSIDTDIKGTTLAVGAPWGSATTSINETDEGLVYIYRQDLNVSESFDLQPGTPLVSPNSAQDNFFGFSVALNGENGTYLLVGEPGFDYNETDTLTNNTAYLENAGAAYIFSDWCGYWDYYGLMFNATLTTSTDSTTGVTTVSPINYFFGVSVDMDDCATDIVIADSYNKVDVFSWVPYFTPIFNVTVTSNAVDEPFPNIANATVTLVGPLPNDTTRIQLTNVDGYTTFETIGDDIIKPGVYNVSVEADGYFGQTGNVTLAMNAITNMFFSLSTNPRVQFFASDSFTGGSLTLPGSNVTTEATFNLYDANGTFATSGTTVDGQLYFLGPLDVGTYTYNATATGYETFDGTLDLVFDTFYTVNISMIPAFAEVNARILDTNGAIVQDALVVIDTALGGSYQQLTDADGWANFTAVRTGEFNITATKTNFGTFTSTSTLPVAGITLTAQINPTSLTIEVTSNITGTALEGAVVEIVNAGNTFSQTTPANGSVKFDYLVANTTTTYAISANNHFASSGSLVLPEGFGTTLPVDLQSDIAEVQFTVVNNLNNVVVGASVTYAFQNGTVITETTDANGQVLFVDVDLGTMSVDVVAATYDNQTATATPVSGTLVTSEITLVSQIAVLNVTLLQADGTSFATDAQVTLVTNTDGVTQVLNSTTTGEVSYLNVTPGTYDLSIVAANMLPVAQTGSIAADDNTNLNVTLFATEANFAFSVTGEDAGGTAAQPIEDAVITLNTLQNGNSNTANTSATGAATFTAVDAGEYTYTVAAKYFDTFTSTPGTDFALSSAVISVPVAMTRIIGTLRFEIVNQTSSTPITQIDAVINLEDSTSNTLTENTLTGFAEFTNLNAGLFTATPSVGTTTYPAQTVDLTTSGITTVTVNVT